MQGVFSAEEIERGDEAVRFLAAFLILCMAGAAGDAVISVGWATFLMLWKISDTIDERMIRK